MNNSDETEAVRAAHSERESTQSQIELQCEFCGCSTKEDVIRAALWTNRGLVVIEDIPVRLCEGCGEQFFEEEITQRIREVLAYPGAKTKRQIRVPVCSMTGVGVANKGRHSQAAGRPHAVPSDATEQQQEQASERVSADQSCRESLHCKYCKAETVEGLVKSALWVDGRLLAIEDIPARVCRQCKERFYDDNTAEKMAALEKGRFSQETTHRDVMVPVFSLADGIGPPRDSHCQVQTECSDPMRRLTIAPNERGR